MKKNTLAIIAFILVNIIVFAGGLVRLNNTIEKTFLSGVVPHFIAFFTLALVYSLVLMSYKAKHPFLISFFYAVFVGVILEFVQLQIGYRTFDIYDMMVDTIGALCYSVVGYILYKKGFFEKYWM
jgi:VanZ family protein